MRLSKIDSNDYQFASSVHLQEVLPGLAIFDLFPVIWPTKGFALRRTLVTAKPAIETKRLKKTNKVTQALARS